MKKANRLGGAAAAGQEAERAEGEQAQGGGLGDDAGGDEELAGAGDQAGLIGRTTTESAPKTGGLRYAVDFELINRVGSAAAEGEVKRGAGGHVNVGQVIQIRDADAQDARGDAGIAGVAVGVAEGQRAGTFLRKTADAADCSGNQISLAGSDGNISRAVERYSPSSANEVAIAKSRSCGQASVVDFQF